MVAKKILTYTIMALAIFAFSTVGAEWNVDATHSSIGFKVSHMVVSKARGVFKVFDGKVNFEGESLKDGSVEWNIDVNSVDTENEKRDNHLKSPDFFDAEKFPNMTFKSTKIVMDGDKKFKLIGDMTVKDVTKEMTFECEFNGTIDDPWGNTRAGFSAVGTMNRQDFGIAFSSVMETGGLVVGNEVEISMELELIKAKEEAVK